MSGFDAKERGAEGACGAGIDGELQPSGAAARKIDRRLDGHFDSGKRREPFGFGEAHDFERMADEAFESGVGFSFWHVPSGAWFPVLHREWKWKTV